MISPLAITLAVLAVAVALFLSDRVRPDLVALLALLTLGITGVLTPEEVFAGFSRAAVVTIIAIFVLAEGLRRARATEQAGAGLLRLSGRGEGRLVTVLMLAGASLSLFMNNIAAAAVLLPAGSSAARRAGVSPSRLMMPLAFATLLGGMATLLTTANIVTSGLLGEAGLAGFGLLDFAAVGLPLVAVGIAYMATFGRGRLPARSAAETLADEARARADLVAVYGFDQSLFQAVVPPGSYLDGRPLRESTLREQYAVAVVAVRHGQDTLLSPAPDTVVHTGDVLLLAGDEAEFRRRDVAPYLEILPPSPWREADLRSADTVVVEAVVAPRASLIGHSLRQAHFREKYGLNVLAIWRGGEAITTELSDLALAYGDALLLQGPRQRLAVLRAEPELILFGEGAEKTEASLPAPRRGQRRLAWGVLAATLLAGLAAPAALAELMLAGALAMVLLGLLSMDQAYGAIDWRTVVLVAGMLPLGIALTKTGAADLIAGLLLELAGPLGPPALLAGLVGLTVLLAQTMHGAAVAAIMTPIAIEAARRMGLDGRSLAMGVALATSITFLTPLGHPVNTLAMGLGGYRFRDFLRVGLPLTLLLLLVLLAWLPVVWPLAGP